MRWFFEDEIRSGLKRLALGLQIRVILVAVGIPLWTWALQYRHPGQATIEGIFWICFPLTDLLMASGGYKMGARSGGAAMLVALLLDVYAGLIGLSGSELGRPQVPFAMGGAELIALIGTFSALAWLRGPIEDVDHDYLEGRIYRAMASVIASVACVLVVRAVMWRGMFDGWAALIVAGAVVLLVLISITDVASVLRMAANAEARLVDEREAISDDPASEVDPRTQRHQLLADRAVRGYESIPPAARPGRGGERAGEGPAIPGYHHRRRRDSEGEHD